MKRKKSHLANEYSFAKIGFDTAENEPSKVCLRSLTADPEVDGPNPGGDYAARLPVPAVPGPRRE